ncbi:MAG TPA: hypothetical protein VK906_12230 [Egicoccus sp.]|nr:hypothetical protein [Egicoccus sp.]HSK23942.1 hypothetical protein [Egicoccus sp.]
MPEPSRAAARRLATVALAVAVAACNSTTGPETAVSVEGVRVEVPAGWSEQSGQEPAGVVAARRWSPGEGVESLQVVVGCDGTAEELAAGAAQAPRDPLVVTDAVELEAPDVPGLDAVHRLRITLGAGRQDDAETVRVSGLYGQSGDAIVLVEVAQRAGASDDLADAVLTSVVVAPATVQSACGDG